MIDEADLLTAIVAKLQDIPELVAVLDGDAANIYGYFDSFPQAANRREAIATQKRPSVMVMWQGTTPGTIFGGLVWQYRFSLFIAAPKDASPFTIRRLLVKGVPASGGGQSVDHLSIHPSVYPFTAELPALLPGFLVTDVTGGTLDYYEMSMTLTEIGDA